MAILVPNLSLKGNFVDKDRDIGMAILVPELALKGYFLKAGLKENGHQWQELDHQLGHRCLLKPSEVKKRRE